MSMTSTILGVAIGVVFVFMIFSLFLSTMLEAISAMLKLRGRALRVAIARLIEDPSVPVRQGGFGFVDRAIARLAKAPGATAASAAEVPTRTRETDPRAPQPLSFSAVFCHPLVAAGHEDARPSYVADANFTSALLHALLGAGGELSPAALAARVELLPRGRLRVALETALLDARGDWQKVREGIDRWYAHAMDRLSGEYKRFSQLVTFLLGLALAACFNIDTIKLAQQLYVDPVIRESLMAAAQKHVDENSAGTELQAKIDRWIEQRDLLARTVPGATASPGIPKWELVQHGWIGWLVTALAGMLGAPFWFDLLQKLTNLRGAGPKPPSATAQP